MVAAEAGHDGGGSGSGVEILSYRTWGREVQFLVARSGGEGGDAPSWVSSSEVPAALREAFFQSNAP